MRRPGNPSETPRRMKRPVPNLVFWIAMTIIVVIAIYAYGPSTTSKAQEISYSGFLQEVRANNVVSVELKDQDIKGTLAQPKVLEAGNDPSDKFVSKLPPIDDNALLPLLAEKGVQVTAKTSGNSLLFTLLINFLPILLFVGLLYFIYRQSRNAQQNAMGFGKSTARLYREEMPKVSFKDVAGIEESKKDLMEVVDFLKTPEKYHKLGGKLPRGVLLYGPPGAGKTLLAKAVAGEANVPFLSISASEFVEMFVGVGASRVRNLFARAKEVAPSIVFVDELDAVGRQRGTGFGGGHDEREQTLNQILVEMDGFDERTNIIVIAATNRPDVLDPALLRPGRFDRQVTISLPDKEGRESILKVHTAKIPMKEDVKLNEIARSTPGFSGADLANLANEAAITAARKNHDQVDRSDFEEAMDRIIFGLARNTLLNPEERKMTAYHEGGHAIVAMYTPGADPVHKVTIIPHSRALGVTMQMPEDDRFIYPKEYLLGRMAVMMAGRAADELIFNKKTTGAESDLKAASDLARKMIGVWGMSDDESIGPVHFGLGEEHVFLGRQMTGNGRVYSEETAAKIDKAVADLIDKSEEAAKKTISEHRPELDRLVEALLIEETIEGSDIHAVVRGEKIFKPKSPASATA